MKFSKKPFSKFFTGLVIIVFIILGQSLRVFLFSLGDRHAQSELRKAEITDLQACLRPMDQFDIGITLTFKETDKVFVCGTLISTEEVSLTIYWLMLPDETVIYRNPYGETFHSGYFFSELQEEVPLGKYRVDIYYRRIKLDTVEFTISNK